MHFPDSRVVNYRVNDYRRELTPLLSEYAVTDKLSSKTRIGKVIKWVLEKLVKKGYLRHRVPIERGVTYQQVNVDYRKLYEALMERIYYFESRHIQIECITVGRDQYRDIIGDMKLARHIDFQIGAECNIPSLRGIRIIMNPFMDGVVFIPRQQW